MESHRNTRPDDLYLRLCYRDELGNRDELAWRDFYRETSPNLYRFFGKSFPSPEDVEEYVDDAYITIHKSIGTYRGEPTLYGLCGFLYGIARNLVKQQIGKQIKDRERREKCEDHILEQSLIGDDSLEEEMRREEMEERLIAVLQDVRPEVKQIVRLRFFEGKTYKEIAKMLFIKPRTVEKRLERAIQKLYFMQKYLADNSHHVRKKTTVSTP